MSMVWRYMWHLLYIRGSYHASLQLVMKWIGNFEGRGLKRSGGLRRVVVGMHPLRFWISVGGLSHAQRGKASVQMISVQARRLRATTGEFIQ